MSQMTTDQLKALVKELLKDVWALELEPQWKAQQAQHQNWMKELLSGGHKEDKPEKGQMVARMIRALAAAKGDPEKAQAWAKKHWDDENVVKALAAGDAVSGGFLIPEQYSADIIELLRAVAIVRKLNPIQIPMPMGTLTLPKMTGGATAS